MKKSILLLALAVVLGLSLLTAPESAASTCGYRCKFTILYTGEVVEECGTGGRAANCYTDYLSGTCTIWGFVLCA